MSQREPENSDLTQPAEKLLDMITSSWIGQAACVFAELRLADLLRDGPRSCDDLAAATATHGPSLQRLLRALTTVDVCREREDGLFELTPMGAVLDGGASNSLRHWTIWWGKHLWPVWGRLDYSIATGKSARALLQGTEGFKHLENDPEAALTFNHALAELTRFAAKSVVSAYDFSQFKTVVDVGGGYGELLACILQANPGVKGILFDRPDAIPGARNHFEHLNLHHRCEFVGGDFFESVPSGGDAYILKSVIHDWNNDRARVILQNCVKAMPTKSRLSLVERVLPKKLEATPAHRSAVRSDLTMLVAHAAQERTEEQMRELLQSAGLQVTRILPAGMLSVIETSPMVL